MALISANGKANQDCLGFALVRLDTAFAFLLALAFLCLLPGRSCLPFESKLQQPRLALLFLCLWAGAARLFDLDRRRTFKTSLLLFRAGGRAAFGEGFRGAS